MNGLRFKVGELAIVACDLNGEGWEGSCIEIIDVGPFWSPRDERWYDYVTSNPDDEHDELWAMDIELRKLDPPAEPKTMTVVEEVGV